MLFRPAMKHDQGMTSVLDDAGFTYSMWGGYIRESYGRSVIDWVESRGIPWQSIHTSGHASVLDLKRFAAALQPRQLVPIHSFETGRFGEFFENVVRKEDSVWWEV